MGDLAKLTREEWDAVELIRSVAQKSPHAGESKLWFALNRVMDMLDRRLPEPPKPTVAELMETFLKTFRFDDRQKLWEAIVESGRYGFRHHLELAGSEVTIRAVANDPNAPPHKHYVIEIS